MAKIVLVYDLFAVVSDGVAQLCVEAPADGRERALVNVGNVEGVDVADNPRVHNGAGGIGCCASASGERREEDEDVVVQHHFEWRQKLVEVSIRAKEKKGNGGAVESTSCIAVKCEGNDDRTLLS